MREDYARRYRTLWERHWWWRSREAFLLGWIERLHRRAPRRRILDIGCGDGLFFERLERFGRVEGLEPDATLIADPRWRARIRQESVAEFRGRGQYELVLMLDVLEHIEDDRAALASAWSAVRPGGHLIVTVPALAWLWSRHDEANEHYRRYEPDTLRRVLDDAGFVIETLRFFFGWTVGPMVARRWLAPAGAGAAEYDVPIPHPLVNRALDGLSRCDHALGRWIPWPLGSSLLAVARRPLASERPAQTARGDFRRHAVALAAVSTKNGAATHSERTEPCDLTL